MPRITRSQTKKIQKQESSLILSLPQDLLMHCIARVPKQNYRNLSRVCKIFQTIVTSPYLFAKRSLLKCTETYIYVSFRYGYNGFIRWYTLVRDNNISSKKKLVPVTSLPSIPSLGGYVAFGSKIFVISGFQYKKLTSDVSIIDCRFDVAKSISVMPESFCGPVVSDVIDGKIYVVGGVLGTRKRQGMLILDTDAETWEYGTRFCSDGYKDGVVTSVEKDGKKGRIYVRSGEKISVFEGNEGKWEELLAGNKEDPLYRMLGIDNGCVVDEILYVFDIRKGCCLRAYDLKQRLYLGVVKGLEGLVKEGVAKSAVSYYGEKKLIVLLLQREEKWDDTKIWCAEIALMEKNENGDIWGNVECFQVVYEGNVSIQNCLTVTV